MSGALEEPADAVAEDDELDAIGLGVEPAPEPAAAQDTGPQEEPAATADVRQDDDEEDLDALGLGLGAGEEVPGAEEAGDASQPNRDDLAILDDPDAAHHSEAEEEEEPSKDRKERDARERIAAEIAFLISKMERSIDTDSQNVAAGKPGHAKLQTLKEMEVQVAKVTTHHLLLQSGFLGLLKGFLEPLEQPTKKRGRDGDMVPSLALPHRKVREAVYRTLQRLPLDTHHQEARDHIKRSQIGPVLRFYSKVEQETIQNRRLLNDILLGWTMPVVEEGRESMRDRHAEEREKQVALDARRKARAAMRAAEAREAKASQEEQQGKVVGERGYRYHARVPRAAMPDYINAPAAAARAAIPTQERAPKGKGTTSDWIRKQNLKLRQQQKVAATRSGKLELSTKNVGRDIV